MPFLDEFGTPYKYVAARTDITALRESEERLFRSQKFAHIGTWDLDLVKNEIYWSEGVSDLFGIKQKTSRITYEKYINTILEEDRVKVIKAIKNCKELDKDYSTEYRVIWQDGSLHWLHEIGNILCDESGRPLHMMGIVRDITKRKVAELGMISAREEAENANQAKSQFLSSMSHELRTPLNAIIGFTQILEMETDPPLSESQQDDVEEISAAGKHLLKLINEILDLAKIEAGETALSIGSIGVEETLFSTLKLISSLAEKRGIKIFTHSEGQAINLIHIEKSNTFVQADKTRFKQALLNLLSNAVKYNYENGKIVINIEAIELGKIRVSVSDSGKGLSPEQQSQLFTAFNRLEMNTSDIEGTGIGLVITKNIIELMGGQIGVKSQLNKGTTFWIELPSKESIYMQKKTTEESISAHLKTHSIKKQYVILYIEDNPSNLKLIQRILESHSQFKIISSYDGKEGIEIALNESPDLILLDINIPSLNGFEVLKELKNTNTTQHIPIIALSANAMLSDIQKGLDSGFINYLTKPIDIEIFWDAIFNALKINH
ncbi:PAS domain-containing hybrid sensor histidine kinase/response regulator [Pseudoalteromonas denitrificans]|uniref:histidine kinase n=1 Tax=Pseudoalteromonas denitrificans DSM 6059 TaxID=1123010 RepID=A0A1I1MQX0_9GAMM|nr:PAS domain-containing hybrid sensor histidine kinase/response regulator [Pseudoalteromonas denitrificans]SFC87506.1 PAS domain S-box-containing protein [Pseudoalteromonas denitrificans DSM 6059]